MPQSLQLLIVSFHGMPQTGMENLAEVFYALGKTCAWLAAARRMAPAANGGGGMAIDWERIRQVKFRTRDTATGVADWRASDLTGGIGVARHRRQGWCALL